MSALDIISQPELPVELNFKLPSSLPSARSREVRVSPINGNSFTVSSSSQVLQFDIPCGISGDYLDPTSTYIRWKTTFSHGGVNGTDYSRILGSGYSFFNLQRVLGNNSSVLEEINECGVLVNMLSQTQLNSADKLGLSSMMGYGFDSYAATTATGGHRINFNTNTENVSFEYAVPLIGILGSGTDKLIPVGKIFGLRLELTCDTPSNFITLLTATAANNVSQYVISEIEFVGNYVTLGAESEALVNSMNPDKIHIRTQSWRQTAAVLPASSNGTNELLCNIRVNSLKSIYLACSIAGAAEKKFSGINPNLGAGSGWLAGGQLYPQRGLDPSSKSADCFAELQKSFGALNMVNYNSSISKTGYYTASTATGLMSAYNTTVANITSNPNQFFMGIDTEILQRKEALLSGISTYGSGLMFRANIGSALAAVSHTLNFFAIYDVILELDVNAKSIVSKF